MFERYSRWPDKKTPTQYIYHFSLDCIEAYQTIANEDGYSKAVVTVLQLVFCSEKGSRCFQIDFQVIFISSFVRRS